MDHAEVALYSQVGPHFIEIGGAGYKRMAHEREVVFEALDNWALITHVAVISKGIRCFVR